MFLCIDWIPHQTGEQKQQPNYKSAVCFILAQHFLFHCLAHPTLFCSFLYRVSQWMTIEICVCAWILCVCVCAREREREKVCASGLGSLVWRKYLLFISHPLLSSLISVSSDSLTTPVSQDGIFSDIPFFVDKSSRSLPVSSVSWCTISQSVQSVPLAHRLCPKRRKRWQIWAAICVSLSPSHTS